MPDRGVRYTDGKTTKNQFVSLRWENEHLVILDDEGDVLGQWSYMDIRRFPLPGTGDMQIGDGFDLGARLRISKGDEIIKCRQHCPSLEVKKNKEPGWWKAYAFWSSAAVASLVLLFWIVIPGLSHQIVKLIPYSWEQELGETTEDSILTLLSKYEKKPVEKLYCGSTNGLAALSKMTNPLVKSLGNDLDIQVRIIDTDMVNAITLPGGRILVFRGLLDKASHPNELAGVIGHEIGHVVYRHGMENFISATAITGLISLLVGDASGGLVMAGFMDTLVNSSNSREAEVEADTYGLAILEELALDHEPMEKMLAKLGSDNSDHWILDWISSHPGMEARIARANAAPSQKGRSLIFRDWRALKTICD